MQFTPNEDPPRFQTRPEARLEPAPAAGALLRDWRTRRRRSQLDLALEAGVSTRHLSFIENGRARPSAAMLLALAESLALPLRERNRLLLAGGYAPRFAESPLGAPAMAGARAAVARLLAAHQPYPGVALDAAWDVVEANGAARALLTMFPAACVGGAPNAFRLALHPQGLAQATLNFAEWAAHLLRQLRALVEARGDAALAAIEREVRAYPNVVAALAQASSSSESVDAEDGSAPALLMPCELELCGERIAMFTTLTAFSSPRSVVLDELLIELFYPADEASAARLRALGTARSDTVALLNR